MIKTLSRVATLATFAIALGSVHLAHAVLADGKPLPAGTYQLRLSDEFPKPAVGQTPNAEQWVEFMKDGKVVGREVASVISAKQVRDRATGAQPRPNGTRVDTLKGGDYVRIWVNRGDLNYLINLVKR